MNNSVYSQIHDEVIGSIHLRPIVSIGRIPQVYSGKGLASFQIERRINDLLVSPIRSIVGRCKDQIRTKIVLQKIIEDFKPMKTKWEKER